MFGAIYRNTVKNLLRSRAFWVAFAVVLVYLFYDGVFVTHYGYMDMETFETIWDTDPRYELTHSQFIKLMPNLTQGGLLYAMSFFSVIATVLTLNRDYGDRFFELEKSLGVKMHWYLLARISALISLCMAFNLLLNTSTALVYMVTRGGVTDMPPLDALADALYRILRLNMCLALPCMLFFIVLTYFAGTVFRNGFAGAGFGLGYALMTLYISKFVRWNSGDTLQFIAHYLLPVPRYGVERLYSLPGEMSEELLEILYESTGYTPTAGLITLVILFCSPLPFILLSYLRVRKRTI